MYLGVETKIQLPAKFAITIVTRYCSETRPTNYFGQHYKTNVVLLIQK